MEEEIEFIRAKIDKAEVMKSFKDAEARVMKKIKARMKKLAKDPVLLAQMEKEIKNELR